MRWPRSRIIQALISIAGATTIAPGAFRLIFNARMAVYVREYPHDGQDSLSAAVDALEAFVAIEVCLSVALYLIQ